MDETADETAPQRLLIKAGRWMGAESMTLNIVGTALIFVVMALVNADVIGRTAFGAPISGVPEIVSLSIVAIVFLQVTQSVRAGRLIRSDELVNLAPPRLRSALFALYDLAALALIAVLLRASWPLFVKAWERDTFVGAVGDFTAPVWPVKLIILIGCAALTAQFALGLARALLALGRR